jgi:hypothetical protein
MSPSSRPSLRVLLCDDCCCGTDRKHPGVDHAGLHSRLSSAAASAGGQSRRVGCLGVCERSNVVVVKTRSSGTFWFGEVLSEPVVADLEAWIRNGTPLPVPLGARSHVFDHRSLAVEPDLNPATVAEFVELQAGVLK